MKFSSLMVSTTSSFPCLLLFPTQWSAQWKLHSCRLHMTMNYIHQDYIYTPKPLILWTQTLNVFGHTKWWTFILPCSSHHPQTLGNVILLQLLDMRNKNPYYKSKNFYIEIWKLSSVLWESKISISFLPSNFSISFIDALKKINSMT
jgi:hypothetical protein